MSALLQQLLGFFRRHPFVIICSALSILLWVANYLIWQRHQELVASHQTLQRNGEDMLQSLTNHRRVTGRVSGRMKKKPTMSVTTPGVSSSVPPMSTSAASAS